MLEFLNENTTFAEILLLRKVDSLVLVVEGPDDRLALKRHVSKELILVAGVGGKPNVLKTAQIAYQEGLSDVRFLLDRDYDEYAADNTVSIGNVIYSTKHDMFTDIAARNPSLLLDIIDVKMDSVRRKGGSSIPTNDDILSSALNLADLAAVRIVDARRKLCLSFRKFRFGGLDTREFDVRTIAQKVFERSEFSLNLDSEVVSAIMNDVESMRIEIEDYEYPPIGDHDLFEALARILKLYKVYESDSQLREAFILTITCKSLMATEWFRKLNDWGKSFGISIIKN